MAQPVRLLEFQPRWREIEHQDRSRLGSAYCSLGGDAMLGARVRSADGAFRVVIRAKNLRDYRTLLPGGTRFSVAAEALDAFAPSHLQWDIALEIEEKKTSPARLDGQTQLGWTGWIGKPSRRNRIRQDARLRRQRPRRRANQGEKAA
jgi:type VI secretion system protein ImpH